MNILNRIRYSAIMCTLMLVFLFGCTKNDDIQYWKIGDGSPMASVIVDADKKVKVKVCSDKYKKVGFPISVNVDYDEKTYFGILEGVCITLEAKKIVVKFATPSSGKVATGTFEILKN